MTGEKINREFGLYKAIGTRGAGEVVGGWRAEKAGEERRVSTISARGRAGSWAGWWRCCYG